VGAGRWANSDRLAAEKADILKLFWGAFPLLYVAVVDGSKGVCSLSM
jgi:hypothetical protein